MRGGQRLGLWSRNTCQGCVCWQTLPPEALLALTHLQGKGNHDLTTALTRSTKTR